MRIHRAQIPIKSKGQHDISRFDPNASMSGQQVHRGLIREIPQKSRFKFLRSRFNQRKNACIFGAFVFANPATRMASFRCATSAAITSLQSGNRERILL